MAQSMAAEIKTTTKPKGPSAYMPQLWFGRTPWLIIGQHENGTFAQLKITNTAALFTSWEERNQVDLRKLVTALARLREAVTEHGGSHCVAIYEKTANTPEIKVYPSSAVKKAVPDDLRRMLWDSWSTGPPAP
ncbi:geranylgeranyl pyrophosphate synthetase [Colletotrichum sp. SAR 10_96]|nr:geranylgeranyl pyrophosphate synthetase [Colletotrichum sp. SAR 10_96]